MKRTALRRAQDGRAALGLPTFFCILCLAAVTPGCGRRPAPDETGAVARRWKVSGRLAIPEDGMNVVMITSDGTTVVAGGYAGTVYVIDAKTAAIRYEMTKALDLICSAGFAQPDVILCDLHMKTMDGMEFCNTMRRDKSIPRPEIPIIILTGDQDPLMHEVTRQIGAATVLVKPVSAEELLSKIEAAVGYTV